MKQRSEELDQWLEEESREDPLRDDEDPELATEGLEVIFDASETDGPPSGKKEEEGREAVWTSIRFEDDHVQCLVYADQDDGSKPHMNLL